MGEHLEPVVACDTDESKAYRLCSADRQSRRRRDADYDGRSNHASLLHKLDRNTARQHNDAQRGRLAGMQQSARQLVERIVPPDVFTEDQFSARPPKCCSVDSAGLHIQLLSGWHRGHRLCDALPAHLQIAAHERYRAIGFGQTLETAHTASSWSDET